MGQADSDDSKYSILQESPGAGLGFLAFWDFLLTAVSLLE
jgi:hypothetical protein